MTKTLSSASVFSTTKPVRYSAAGVRAELPPDEAAETDAERDVERREHQAFGHADLVVVAVQDAEVERQQRRRRSQQRKARATRAGQGREREARFPFGTSLRWGCAPEPGGPRRCDQVGPAPGRNAPDAVRHRDVLSPEGPGPQSLSGRARGSTGQGARQENRTATGPTDRDRRCPARRPEAHRGTDLRLAGRSGRDY